LRPFSDFRAGDPYVLRAFSEQLRLQLELLFEGRDRKWQFEPEAGRLLQESIFGKLELKVDTIGGQRELVLTVMGHDIPECQITLKAVFRLRCLPRISRSSKVARRSQGRADRRGGADP